MAIRMFIRQLKEWFMDKFLYQPFTGAYHEVGVCDHREYIYPSATAEQRALIREVLKKRTLNHQRMCPIAYIPADNNVKVIHFKTLEEANMDQERSMLCIAKKLEEKSEYAFRTK